MPSDRSTLVVGTRVHHRAYEYSRWLRPDPGTGGPGWATIIEIDPKPYSDGSIEYHVTRDAPVFEGGSIDTWWANYHLDEVMA